MQVSKKARGDIMLFIAALIWGSAFVAQKQGGSIGSFTYNGLRSFLGFLVIFIYIIIRDRCAAAKPSDRPSGSGRSRAELVKASLICGAALFVATSCQQIGLAYTDVGKAGFITSLYTVIVPFFSVFLHKKVHLRTWLCAGLGVIGFYFLSMKGFDFRIGRGDVFVLVSAFCYAIQIVAVDVFSDKVDGVKLSASQFLVIAVLSIAPAFSESPSLAEVMSAWPAIAYGGVLSCGVAYTLQIQGQKDTEPAQASLIMCLESVFSAIFGALLLHENLGARAYFGCAIIFTAVVLSNLPFKTGAESAAR
ncbi:MAG: DMT family transporter [Anaerovoracaceae bacterium]